MPSLLAILGLNASSFSAGLNRAGSQAASVGQKIGGALSHHITGALAGIASIGAFEHFTESTTNWASSLVDLSNRLGISVEAVQKFDYALRKNGESADAMAPFFLKLAKARDAALKGTGDARDAFKQLGVSIDDLKSKRLEDLVLQIGDIFKAGGDPQRLMGALAQVGGKGAGAFVAAMRDDLREAADEAERLGGILDSVTARELKDSEDEMKIMGTQAKVALAPLAEFWERFKVGTLRGLTATFLSIRSFIRYGDLSEPKDYFFNQAAMDMALEKKRADQTAEAEKQRQKAIDVENQKEAQKKRDRMAKLLEQIDRQATENDMKTMTREQQLQALLRKRAELLQKNARVKDPEEFLKTGVEIGKIEGEILDLQKAAEKSRPPRIELNQLQRIGGYAAMPPGLVEIQQHVRTIPGKLDRVITNTKPQPRPAGRTGTRF